MMQIFGFKRQILKTVITFLGIKFAIRRPCEKIVKKHYAQKLEELRHVFGTRKLKVGFLIHEQAKWQYQSLYEEMKKSPFFEPVVLVTELVFNLKKYYKTIDDCYLFFKNKGLNVRYVYDSNTQKYTPAKDFDVDILFYQQPWMLDTSQHPLYASKYALTCYVPYSMHLVECDLDYLDYFHQLLWMMFIDNPYQIEKIKTFCQNDINARYVGYSKLDAYFNLKPHKNKKKTVIYAPHHSFEQDGINCATFRENGQKILKLAQKYRAQAYWIFKPHPRFQTALILNNIMSEEEMKAYYHEWEKLGCVFESGDYFQLFADSDALITDCVSFLGEYLPSQKPIFHLISPLAQFNAFAKSFIGSFYQIRDVSDLEKALQKVVFQNQDTKKKERLLKIPLVFDCKEPVATKIMNFLINCFTNLKKENPRN